MNEPLFSEDAVYAALVACDGHVGHAALQFGVGRTELWEFIRVRPRLADYIVGLREQMAQNAYQAVHEGIEKQKPWAITFTLAELQPGNRTPPAQPVPNLPTRQSRCCVGPRRRPKQLLPHPKQIAASDWNSPERRYSTRWSIAPGRSARPPGNST